MRTLVNAMRTFPPAAVYQDRDEAREGAMFWRNPEGGRCAHAVIESGWDAAAVVAESERWADDWLAGRIPLLGQQAA